MALSPEELDYMIKQYGPARRGAMDYGPEFHEFSRPMELMRRHDLPMLDAPMPSQEPDLERERFIRQLLDQLERNR